MILLHGLGQPAHTIDTASLPMSTDRPESPARPLPVLSGPGVSRAFLTLEVKGRPYGLTIGADTMTLEKPDGTQYEITRGDGPTCTCRDFFHRHAGLLTEGCIHVRALRAANLLPPVLRLPEPWPSPIIDTRPDVPMSREELDAARAFGMA